MVRNGTLVEKVTGKPARMHGVNFFGWNAQTPNFDGLWAWKDADIPGVDAVGEQNCWVTSWGNRFCSPQSTKANQLLSDIHRLLSAPTP